MAFIRTGRTPLGDARRQYQEDGYVVFRQCLSADAIDRLCHRFREEILPCRRPFFRQSSNRWERHRISPQGHMEESILDPHDLAEFPEFSSRVLELVCGRAIRRALSELTGVSDHRLMQTMFFDRNAATPAHQDGYYLDSLPSGHLLAAWIALEDIPEEAGRFYVLPGSHLHRFELNPEELSSNGRYLAKVSRYVGDHQARVTAPALRKGDVLFWNSRTVHGALPTRDSRYSRKSLTAHYLPEGYGFGRARTEREWEEIAAEYREVHGMLCRRVPEQFRRYSLANKIRTDVWTYLWYRPRLNRWLSPMLAAARKLRRALA